MPGHPLLTCASTPVGSSYSQLFEPLSTIVSAQTSSPEICMQSPHPPLHFLPWKKDLFAVIGLLAKFAPYPGLTSVLLSSLPFMDLNTSFKWHGNSDHFGYLTVSSEKGCLRVCLCWKSGEVGRWLKPVTQVLC